MSGQFYIIATGDAHVLRLLLIPTSKPLESPKGFRVPNSCESVGAPCVHDHTQPFQEVATSAWHCNCIPTRVVTQTSSNSWCLAANWNHRHNCCRSCQSVMGGCSRSANNQTEVLRLVFRQCFPIHQVTNGDDFLGNTNIARPSCGVLNSKGTGFCCLHTQFDLSKWSMVNGAS